MKVGNENEIAMSEGKMQNNEMRLQVVVVDGWMGGLVGVSMRLTGPWAESSHPADAAHRVNL